MSAFLEKQCECRGASASGPRLVFKPIKVGDHGITVPAEWVEMACDRCDTPWRCATGEET